MSEWSVEPFDPADIAPEGDPGHDCDGGDDDHHQVRFAATKTSTDASDRGWGPGWPNCQYGTIVTLTRPDGLRLPVRRELADLIAWLIDETERRAYDVIPGWTWGYACRAIRGSNKPSNHSWGLAVDVNAPTNPMTSNGQLITDMPSWLPELWGRYGFRWGGAYAGSRKDAMHLEFMEAPADAARYTAQITQTPKDWFDTMDEKTFDKKLAEAFAARGLDVIPESKRDGKGNLLLRFRDSIAKQETRSVEIVKGIRALLKRKG